MVDLEIGFVEDYMGGTGKMAVLGQTVGIVYNNHQVVVEVEGRTIRDCIHIGRVLLILLVGRLRLRWGNYNNRQAVALEGRVRATIVEVASQKT
jgi:hypothetical protein